MNKELHIFSKGEKLMGNHFEITVACEHQEDADYFIEMAILEIRRIESLLTTFRPDSQTNKINQREIIFH